MNMEMLILENEWIKLVCYPSIGGKIASIWYKPLSRELLWQSQDGYKIPTYGASFSDYDKSGIDECFPMIDAEDLSWEGNTYRLPDHGELWCQPWEMIKAYGEKYLEKSGIIPSKESLACRTPLYISNTKFKTMNFLTFQDSGHFTPCLLPLKP
jgi:hypothetical protein